MPRRTQDELVGYGFVVHQGEQQQHAPDGMPLFNGTGEPKMQAVWTVVFTGDTPGVRHEVSIPFDEAGRDALVKGLTGVQVATEMPKGPIVL